MTIRNQRKRKQRFFCAFLQRLYFLIMIKRYTHLQGKGEIHFLPIQVLLGTKFLAAVVACCSLLPSRGLGSFVVRVQRGSCCEARVAMVEECTRVVRPCFQSAVVSVVSQQQCLVFGVGVLGVWCWVLITVFGVGGGTK